MIDEMTPRGENDVLDEMLRVRKDTRVKMKKRAPIPPLAKEMPEICVFVVLAMSVSSPLIFRASLVSNDSENTIGSAKAPETQASLES
jgi:hypothetical protein